MSLSFTVFFHSLSAERSELIVWRQNEEPLTATFNPPYPNAQLDAVLKALEFMNQQSQHANLTTEDKLALQSIKDEPDDLSYWYDGKLVADLPKRVGYRLYQALFSGSIGEAFRETYRQVLRDRDETCLNLCIQIEPEDTVSARYPWELMRQDLAAPLLILNRVIFTRQVLTGTPLSDVVLPSPASLMMVVSRPTDVPTLSTSDRKAVEEALAQHKSFGNVNLLPAPSVFFDLLDVIVDHHPSMIHFDGHGAFGRFCPACKARGRRSFVEWWQSRCPETDCQADLSQVLSQGFLIFEDKQGRSDFILASELGDRLAGLGTKLFFLSACQTATIGHGSVFNAVAPMLVRAGIPAVVAMQFSVAADESARFSQRFYKSLGSGRKIEDSLTDARRLLTDQEIFRPVLYLCAPSKQTQPITAAVTTAPGLPMPILSPDADNSFDNLRGWLDGLLDNEFRGMIYSLLSITEQNHLSLPVQQIDRSTFLGNMQSLGRLGQVEAYLSRKYLDRLRK